MINSVGGKRQEMISGCVKSKAFFCLPKDVFCLFILKCTMESQLLLGWMAFERQVTDVWTRHYALFHLHGSLSSDGNWFRVTAMMMKMMSGQMIRVRDHSYNITQDYHKIKSVYTLNNNMLKMRIILIGRLCLCYLFSVNTLADIVIWKWNHR